MGLAVIALGVGGASSQAPAASEKERIFPVEISLDAETAGAGTSSGAVHTNSITRIDRRARCPHARRAIQFYRGHYIRHRVKMGAVGSQPVRRVQADCPQAQFLARVWKSRAYVAREAAEVVLMLRARTLRDFEVRPGNNAWFRAIEESQKIFPGTSWWLKSCSATEGGWGRWVPNSDGAPPGGWMQMYESTFWRMWATAKAHAEARGFKVPRSAASWYSPLGQALASAWGLTNGRRGEWNSSGC